jgi:hypothetical protein
MPGRYVGRGVSGKVRPLVWDMHAWAETASLLSGCAIP